MSGMQSICSMCIRASIEDGKENGILPVHGHRAFYNLFQNPDHRNKFRPERGKKEALSAGIFAAANVLLRLCPGVPGWARYAVSAAAVLGYCRIRYKGCLEKAVFTLLLLYNFHGMSFLVSNSLYQFLMDGLNAGVHWLLQICLRTTLPFFPFPA